MICCPDCKINAEKRTHDSYRCRKCRRHFPLSAAFIVHDDKPQRYKGQPAGTITIGRGHVWGAGW